jgi:hypothetical protein
MRERFGLAAGVWGVLPWRPVRMITVGGPTRDIAAWYDELLPVGSDPHKTAVGSPSFSGGRGHSGPPRPLLPRPRRLTLHSREVEGIADRHGRHCLDPSIA